MTSPHGVYHNHPSIVFIGTDNLFPVPVCRIDEAKRRIKKLVNKANRLGVDKPLFKIVAKGFEDRAVPCGYHSDGTVKYKDEAVPMLYYQVTAEKVKLSDWTFAAKLEPLTSFGRALIVRSVPEFGYPIPEQFRNAENVCDHCGKSRNRKLLYVLRHEDGTWIKVGSNCLADFLGHDPKKAIQYLSWFYEMESSCRDMGGLPGSIRLYPVDDFMAFTSAVIRLNGWQSKAGSDEHHTPTVWTVLECFEQPKKNYNPAVIYEPIESDLERSRKVLDWIRNDVDKRESKSDYEYNLCLALASDLLDARLAGIAASGVAAYMRHLDKLAEIQKRKESAGMSEFVGEIKERLRDIRVTVDRVQSLSGDYGAITLIKFKDDLNNVLTWFASGDYDIEPGDKYLLTGTVKKHNDWKGLKETILSRCKIERID